MRGKMMQKRHAKSHEQYEAVAKYHTSTWRATAGHLRPIDPFE
jgi:hypothetical protein